jgi:hypothetical protein
LIDLINIFAGATAAPAAVFVDLVLGSSAKTVFSKFPPSGDVRSRAASIAMERPKLGFQGITRRAVKRTEIGISGGALAMKGRIEVPFSEKLGCPWRAVVLGEDPRLGMAPAGIHSVGMPCAVKPFPQMKPR